MEDKFSQEEYEMMIRRLCSRFRSFQNVGSDAYKPGMANMEFADQLLGHPHRKYKIIHVAGTNGKGSVSNMLTSVLAGLGLNVGLYTSPHLLDFRERIRIVRETSPRVELGRNDGVSFREGTGAGSKNVYTLIPKEDVWSFVNRWKDTFEHLDMSFFEITTLMALDWFAGQEVDVVVLETGLGGRLDSTNIVTPVLSVITNIGYDHCDLLGETLPEIAFEKAGIIKPGVPVVVGEGSSEINPVFERKVLYTNLSKPEFMGDRNAVMSLLTYAERVEPSLWDRHEKILSEMDLQGAYQVRNLRTVLAAVDVIASRNLLVGTPAAVRLHTYMAHPEKTASCSSIAESVVHTASRTGFHGRWEKLSDKPYIICDIGHNEHGLRYNFSRLENMLSEGTFTHLIIVYGSVADKDVDAVLNILPASASYIFTQAQGRRALSADAIAAKYQAMCIKEGREEGRVLSIDTVADAVKAAYDMADSITASDDSARPLIYIGGSTYVVSEAISSLKPDNSGFED